MSFDELSSSSDIPLRRSRPPVGVDLGRSDLIEISSESDEPSPSLDRLRRSIRRLRSTTDGTAERDEALRAYERAFTLHHASEAEDIEDSSEDLDKQPPFHVPPPAGKQLTPRMVEALRRASTSVPPVVDLVDSSHSDDGLLVEPPKPRRPLERQNANVAQPRDVSPVRNPHGQAPSKPGSMAKDWCYTLNSPSRDDVARLRRISESDPSKVLYHVFQIERGAAGNLHIQGFICLASRARMSTVKTLLGQAVHLEVRRGTPLQAADYCRDPAKRDPRHAGFLFEYGDLPDPPAGQGARSDLAAVQSLLDNHVPMATVAREHFNTWVKSYKAFDKYVTEYVSEPRKEKSLFFCFTGESGTGKSQAAYAFRDAFTVPPGSSGVAWFDGYDALRHLTVLFDEFSGSRCSWTELLRLTDKYAHTVNTKGSQQQFNPKALVFTSNAEPVDWYPNIPEKLPLTRRIDAHWQYYRRDTKALSPNIMQAVDGLEVANQKRYHAIVCCNKGDPTYHPMVASYERLLLDAEGKQWFVIPAVEEVAAVPLQGLW
ncbi:replication-associated protein [Crucivirus-387]|nr:replication-associated protein [Crucivirus-387]